MSDIVVNSEVKESAQTWKMWQRPQDRRPGKINVYDSSVNRDSSEGDQEETGKRVEENTPQSCVLEAKLK